MIFVQPIGTQTGQTNEQEPGWELNSGQEWQEADDGESETTKLPADSQDGYYESIKQSLFCYDTDLFGENSYDEQKNGWLTQARNSELKNGQKELINELLDIVGNLDDCDISKLQQFLENNKGNQDLKAVLNLKAGASELALLHILPITLRPSVFNHFALMNCLLKAGADPNIRDYQERTPLYYAADCYEYGFIDLLIENGADPNTRDSKGKTFLHYAAVYAEKECIDSLIKYGADFSIKDNNGKTPMQIAIDKSNDDIIECFFTEEQKKLNKDTYSTSRINLLLAAGTTESQIMATEQETNAPYVPHQCLFDTLPYQLSQLNKFLGKISEAGNMIALQQVVNEAIMSGVRLNFAKDRGGYFTDYVLERIGQLEKNYEVASGIVCTLISKGARLNSWCHLDVIDKIELEFKDHKANMIKAHEQCVNRTQKFLKIAKNATNGKLNCAKIDNTTFYLEYSEDSTIDIAKITDEAVSLGIIQGSMQCGRDVIKIGESEVEIITANGIRHYTDLTDGSDIVLTFYTSQGELKVGLCPDKQDESRINVKVSDKDLLEQLKNLNEEVGKNCRFGELSVNEAIEQGFFVRSGKLMRSETISPSKEVSKKAAVEGLNPGDVASSSLNNTSISSPVKENIQLGARTPD